LKSLDELITSIKTRIAMEMTTPEVLDLSDEAIAIMAVDSIPTIMSKLSFTDLEGLVSPNTPLTMVGESADLPQDYFILKNAATISGKISIFYPDFSNYQGFCGQSDLMTIDEHTPISSIANNKIYFKPVQTDISITYFKKHPPLSPQQGTLLSAVGDKMLEDLIVSKYFASVQDANRAGLEMAQ
jgi:hypothetical protein